MINVYEKYKKDIWAFLSLLVIFIIYCVIFWGRAGDIMIDCPREIWLPEEIREGKSLYTEIFSLYPPLGYYLNTLFIKIFGQSFNLFYLLGMFNTWIILTLIYLLSRRFSEQLLSFSIAILVLCYCAISYSPVTNYIFPYSYSFIYSLSCFLCSVYLLILYFQKEFKTKYILFSLLFAGFSTAFKPEFLPAFLPLFIVLFLKEKSLRNKLAGLVLFILPPVLPFLFDLEGAKIFVHNFLGFCSSPSSKEFLKTLSLKTPKDYCLSTIKDLFFFSLFFAAIYFTLKKSKNFSKLKYWGISCIISIYSYFLTQYILENRIYIFSWLTLFAIVFCIKYLKSKDLLNFTLSSILILSSLRVGGYLASNHYGKYILPLFFVIVFCIYFKEILKDEHYERYISVILITFCIFSLSFFGQSVYNGKNYKIESNKGIIFATKPVGKTISETVSYLKQNSAETDRVLVLPEGLTVNLLSDRKTDSMLYQLLPNHIEIMGEKNIVKRLENKPPEFIVLSSLSTSAYGKSFFCIDYALEICDFINSNYDYLETFSNQEEQRQFMMMVLRLKKD